MASNDLTVQYNQLMWQMDQLREDVVKANKDYTDKLKDLRKKMVQVNAQIEWIGQRMGPRALAELTMPTPFQQHPNRDAGFHPPAA